MVRLISVLVFGGVGVVLILARNAQPYYARPVQSSPGRRVFGGVMLLVFAAVLALGGVMRAGY